MSKIDSYYARFDDLNVICKQYTASYFKKPSARKKCLEEIEDFLIIAYKEGVAAVNEMLGLDLAVSLGLLERALKLEVKGLTYIERIEEHIDSGEFGMIKTVAETEYHRIFTTAEQDTAEEAIEQRKTPAVEPKQETPIVVSSEVEPITGDYGTSFKPLFDDVTQEVPIDITNFSGTHITPEDISYKISKGNDKGSDSEKKSENESKRNITKTWRTRLDNKVRDTHAYLEGVTIGVKDEFITFDGDSAMVPGGFNNVDNNANCRCHLEYKWAE